MAAAGDVVAVRAEAGGAGGKQDNPLAAKRVLGLPDRFRQIGAAASWKLPLAASGASSSWIRGPLAPMVTTAAGA